MLFSFSLTANGKLRKSTREMSISHSQLINCQHAFISTRDALCKTPIPHLVLEYCVRANETLALVERVSIQNTQARYLEIIKTKA